MCSGRCWCWVVRWSRSVSAVGHYWRWWSLDMNYTGTCVTRKGIQPQLTENTLHQDTSELLVWVCPTEFLLNQLHSSMSLSQTEKECLNSVLENVNGWSSPTAQWKRVPESWCRDKETTSSNVDDTWLLFMTSGQEQTTEKVYTFNLWALRRSGLWTPHGTTEHQNRL